MASNKDRNKIQSLTSLTSLTGGRLEDPASIKDEILQYYVGLLGTTFEVSNDARRDLGITSINQCCHFGGDQNLPLLLSKGIKAQGLMGFNSAFFQDNWVQAINQFFLTRELSRQCNSTAITLVPKSNSPPTIKDYRPIACCNVTFKCVSKILANKLQSILPHLSSPLTPSQSDFVKGRSIRDNILLMQELVKNYHLNEGFLDVQ